VGLDSWRPVIVAVMVLLPRWNLRAATSWVNALDRAHAGRSGNDCVANANSTLIGFPMPEYLSNDLCVRNRVLLDLTQVLGVLRLVVRRTLETFDQEEHHLGSVDCRTE